MGRGRGPGPGNGDPSNLAQTVPKQGIGPILDRRGHLISGRTAVGRCNLNRIRWRIVGRSDDDPSATPLLRTGARCGPARRGRAPVSV